MTCTRTNCKNEAIIDHQYGVLPCKQHQKQDEERVNHVRRSPEFYTISMRDRIVAQRDRHEKDNLQPFINANDPNPEFVKAYPEYRKNYYSQEQLRKV